MPSSPSPSGSALASLRALTGALLRRERGGVAAYAGLLVAQSALQGVGLLLLVPLLALVGVAGGEGRAEPITRFFFETLGLPPSLPLVLGLFVGLVALREGVGYAVAVQNARLRLAFVRTLRADLFRAVTWASWAFVAGVRVADVQHVLHQELGRVGASVLHLARLATTAAGVVVYAVLAVVVAPVVAAVAGVAALVLLATVWPLIRRARASGRAVVRTGRRTSALVYDHLASLKEVKSFGAEARAVDGFEVALDDAVRDEQTFAEMQAASKARMGVGAAVLAAALVWFGVAGAGLPPASLLVVVFLLSRLVPQVASVTQIVQQLLHVAPAYDAAMGLYAEALAAREPTEAAPADAPRLREFLTLDGVSFRYADGAPLVLDDVSLTLPAGSVTLVAGPSGAGKSTLADLLLGLLLPTGGRILADGEALTPERLHGWRRRVAYVPQRTVLRHGSVRDNLRWVAPEADDDALWAALDAAAAGDVVRALPLGLDAPLGDHGHGLSGGERQRIALARALLRKPDLLLLDEATSALDRATEARVLDALTALRGRTTLLVISHRPPSSDWADQTVRLRYGRVSVSTREPTEAA